jgi:hypothetical protein
MNPAGLGPKKRKDVPGPQLIKAAMAAKKPVLDGGKRNPTLLPAKVEEAVAEPRRLVSESTK